MSWINFFSFDGSNYNLLNTVTGETLPISIPGEEKISLGYFYPDGEHIMISKTKYTLRDDMARKLKYRFYRRSLLTGEEEALFTKWKAPENMQICNMQYLSEGWYFAVLSSNDAGNQMIFLREDGSDVRVCWQSASYPYGFSVSPDGKKIAFHVASMAGEIDEKYNPSGKYSINVMNIDGSDIKCICSVPHHLFFGPAWSPDGKHIAFLDCHPEEDPAHFFADLAMCNADGSDFRYITQGYRYYNSTAFGLPQYRGGGTNFITWADNEHLLHTLVSEGGHPDAYYDGSQRNHEEKIYDPACGKGSGTIGYVDVRDGSFSPITIPEEGKWEFRGFFSPDKKQLLYTVSRFEKPSEIHLRTLSTGEERILTTGRNNHGADHGSFVPIPDTIIPKFTK